MTVPVKQPIANDIMESVLLKGDIGKLTPDERVAYYGAVCKSMGLNPLTKPFEFVVLNGKMQLYALRTCADQLRKINAVSLEIVSREVENDILTIHVRAKLPDGRCDEDLGAVAFPSTLKGEARANAELKAVTKAKRRATLSICGLGWLDETEVADIPAAAKRPAPPAPNVMLKPGHVSADPALLDHNDEIVDPHTGEIIPPRETAADAASVDQTADKPPADAVPPVPFSHRVAEADRILAAVAQRGTKALEKGWKEVPSDIKPVLKSALDRRHKPTASAIDAAAEGFDE